MWTEIGTLRFKILRAELFLVIRFRIMSWERGCWNSLWMKISKVEKVKKL